MNDAAALAVELNGHRIAIEVFMEPDGDMYFVRVDGAVLCITDHLENARVSFRWLVNLYSQFPPQKRREPRLKTGGPLILYE